MFTDPVKNLRAFGLRDDMIVADLGAGSGFYSLTAAQMVPRGKVYAIEVIKDFLTSIKNKAKEAHLNNMECFWGNIEKVGGTNLKDKIVDAVIASNVLFQVENKEKFIDETKRILKTDGRVLVIDWSDEISSIGSSLNKTISEKQARDMFEKKGFKFDREIDAGNHHYGMIFSKS
jgi:ubiquinone/menaquinone biosynthesis C-methylase UbiE